MRTAMRLRLIAIGLFCVGCRSAQVPDVALGCFSDLNYVAEAGDLAGFEVVFHPASGASRTATLCMWEGGGPPERLPLEVEVVGAQMVLRQLGTKTMITLDAVANGTRLRGRLVLDMGGGHSFSKDVEWARRGDCKCSERE